MSVLKNAPPLSRPHLFEVSTKIQLTRSFWNVIHHLPSDLSAINLKLQAVAQLKINFAPEYMKMVRNYLTVLSYEGDAQL